MNRFIALVTQLATRQRVDTHMAALRTLLKAPHWAQHEQFASAQSALAAVPARFSTLLDVSKVRRVTQPTYDDNSAAAVANARRPVALGALPVFAFSVLPGVAALLASPRLGPVFPIAAALGALSGGLGYIAAFLWEFPVGASQTAVAVAFVVLAVPLRLLRR